MSDKDLYANLMARLVDYFGDYSTLAAVLNVDEDELENCAQGKRRPPTAVFLRAVDLANELAAAEAERRR
jgi:hypothetical protein